MLRSSSGLGASAAGRASSAGEWRPDLEADQEVGRRDRWHDPITGLPRPGCFLKELERILRSPAKDPQPVAIFVLELPDIAVLTAQIGEAYADELLRTVAERLHEEVPEPNLVTRLRGGQFAVVLRGLGSEVTSEELATRLLERVSDPCPVGDRLLGCAALGALTFPDGREQSAMQLLDRGARALARASMRSGRHLRAA